MCWEVVAVARSWAQRVARPGGRVRRASAPAGPGEDGKTPEPEDRVNPADGGWSRAEPTAQPGAGAAALVRKTAWGPKVTGAAVNKHLLRSGRRTRDARPGSLSGHSPGSIHREGLRSCPQEARALLGDTPPAEQEERMSNYVPRCPQMKGPFVAPRVPVGAVSGNRAGMLLGLTCFFKLVTWVADHRGPGGTASPHPLQHARPAG